MSHNITRAETITKFTMQLCRTLLINFQPAGGGQWMVGTKKGEGLVELRWVFKENARYRRVQSSTGARKWLGGTASL
ncbi:hypothetical protein Tco_0662715 [Tanacetum coccineum]